MHVAVTEPLATYNSLSSVYFLIDWKIERRKKELQ
jgi:hypothetical protein